MLRQNIFDFLYSLAEIENQIVLIDNKTIKRYVKRNTVFIHIFRETNWEKEKEQE